MLQPIELEAEYQKFPSRRSVVHSTQGMIACSQPLAARCGLKILDAGGNAADAAVAVAAGLGVTEPSSTGVGGDMFCLFYNAKTKKVEALNGSGRSSSKSTLDIIRRDLGLRDGVEGKIPLDSVHAVTVPGAVAGWVDTVERFGSGKLVLPQILAPAIELAEKGFPVSELSSYMWNNSENKLRKASPNYAELLIADQTNDHALHAPRTGEIFTNVNLARTLRMLAIDGKKGFYTGRIAESIIKAIKDRGGFLELGDFKKHIEMGSQTLDPISYVFKGQNYAQGLASSLKDNKIQGKRSDEYGIEVWECAPNGQGIVALMALGLLEILEEKGIIPKFTKDQHNSVEYLHALIETLRIAFADANWWVCDPAKSKIPYRQLISREYLEDRAELFNPNRVSKKNYSHGDPSHMFCDTVYFSVTDKDGNAISFINSNFSHFGSGIIPEGTGFVLQNRGANFNLTPGHPNSIAPSKRPYHTIIPAMVTNINDGSLHSVYGVMGGFMQPQGHVQVLLNSLIFKYDPQVSLDAPRFCISANNTSSDVSEWEVMLEDGISEQVCEKLRAMGHKARIIRGFRRDIFGRGQLIISRVENGSIVFSGGSDPRGDGAAYPG